MLFVPSLLYLPVKDTTFDMGFAEARMEFVFQRLRFPR
jgi:hypothetical protein